MFRREPAPVAERRHQMGVAHRCRARCLARGDPYHQHRQIGREDGDAGVGLEPGKTQIHSALSGVRDSIEGLI